MKDFDALSKEVSSPNYKAIYGILASRQPAALKGVADSAQEPMNLYPADIKSIQDSLWLEVKDGMAMDGQNSTMEEIGKGLVFNVEKLAAQLKTRPEGMAADAFYNDFTGIGTGLDPGVYNNAYTPVVVSPTEATAYYSNGGIAGAVIDKKSRGIFTNGYQFVGGLEEDELKELKDDADRLNFEESVVEWWRDGWIYGGSCLMPWLKGDNAMTHQMSVKELASGGMLKKGCIQYFWTADRWNSVLIPNYNISARDYLTPEEFMIPLAGLSIKTERMAIGRPKKLPYWGTIRQMGWGISDFPSFMPSLLAYEIMIRSIPVISQQLSLVYLHQPIDIVLAQAGLNAVKDLMKKNQAALDQWNPLKAQALNLAGELKSIDRHWTDFDKLITLGKQDVGAKAQISHTVLFNEQTASLDEKAFDTTLKQAETIKLSANQASIQLQNIIPFLVWNKWGYYSPQGQKAREVRISFDSPTIQTNEEKIASVQAIGTALGQFTQAGLQLGDAMTLVRQFFPGMEIPKDMAERIQAFDDSEQDFQDEQREQTLELGAQKTDSSEEDDEGTGSSGSMASSADEFHEEDHPRQDDGKFGNGSGGNSSQEEATKKRQPRSVIGSNGYKSYLDDNYPGITKAPPAKIKKALIHYTGDGFRSIQAVAMADPETAAKKGVTIGGKTIYPRELPAYQETIKGVETWIHEHKIKEPVILYRGMGLDDELDEGDEVGSRGFSSFSSDISVAEDFVGKKGRHNALFEFVAQEGDELAPIDGHSHYGTGESEFIANRNLKYKVVGKEKKGDMTVYQMELVR